MGPDSDRRRPEGELPGRYCWVVLLLVGFASFFTFFHRMSASVIRADLMETFHLSATSFAVFSSACFYPYMLMQLPVGLLADRWGVRKTVSLGCLLTGLGTLLFSMAGTFRLACLGRALVGLGISTPVVCTQKTAAVWFPEQKVATAGALAGTIGNFGGLCAQTPLALLAGYLGWRASFLSAGAVTLLFALLCAVFLRNEPGETAAQKERTAGAVSGEPVRQPLSVTLKGIFTDWKLLNLMLIMFVQMGIYQMFSGTWGISWLCEVFGCTNLEAAGFTSWMLAGMMLFYLLAPVLSDRIQKRKPLLILLSVLTLAVWLLVSYGSALLANPPVRVLLMLAMGATSSTFPLLFSLIREYCDPEYIGTAIGTCNMIGMAAGALFPVFCGKMIDRLTGSGRTGASVYGHAFTFAVILAAAALAASLLTTETDCRSIFKKSDSEK